MSYKNFPFTFLLLHSSPLFFYLNIHAHVLNRLHKIRISRCKLIIELSQLSCFKFLFLVVHNQELTYTREFNTLPIQLQLRMILLWSQDENHFRSEMVPQSLQLVLWLLLLVGCHLWLPFVHALLHSHQLLPSIKSNDRNNFHLPNLTFWDHAFQVIIINDKKRNVSFRRI